jgi:DNA-binding MarR family transcriptional regulator
MKHYTRDNFHLTDSIGFLIIRVRNLMLTHMDAALKEIYISGQQMRILLSLSQGIASTPFELSTLLGIDTGLMTRMLDKLESMGLLERSRSLEDRRVINLSLTVKGEGVAERIPDIAPEVLNSRLQKFTRAEFVELRRLLEKFLSE